MTMKKRFLGLAMAAAMVVPATTVHAAGTKLVSGNNAILGVPVPVSGTVLNNDGQTPEGKIQVELPTAMAFTVDQKGKFITPEAYTVNNKSAVGITLSVTEFRQSNVNGGITLEDATTFNEAARGGKDRSHIALSLNGYAGGKTTSVDLSKVKPTSVGNPVLDVKADSAGILTLSGIAGTKEAEGDSNTLDTKGVQEDFTLVFKINKNDAII